MSVKFFRFLLLTLLLPVLRGAENWPQFRGPDGTGHSDARGLPLRWSEKGNIVWKTAIHDRGWSSPVIYGKQIWLTSATKDGRELYVLCVDRDSGKILRDWKLFDVGQPQFVHPFNTPASPTPVIEEGRVFITFGAAGTACIDTKTGKTVWQTKRSIDFQDLDKNGKPADDGDLRKAFSTPHVERINGRWEMISLGAKAAYSYDPFTGRELWRVEERGQHSASTRPVVGLGMIFFPTGFPTGQLFAVRMGGEGLITDTHVAWKLKRGVSNKPSILLVDDLIYMIGDAGIASCVDAKTGVQVWQQRIGGEYSASPV